ncbi:MAG TPA: hypothetical protein VF795_01665 [Desulfuromonadaceae bacterium]
MNDTERCAMDPVRERFRNKLQKFGASTDREEIAFLAMGLTRIVDGIRPTGTPRMAATGPASFS